MLIGPPRDVRDPEIFHSLSLVAFLAWVGLGSDGLSSSCYGPEEAFLALGHHQYLAVFLAMLMALTVFIISASYSQTIDLFPTGGGGYLVATKLLGKYFGPRFRLRAGGRLRADDCDFDRERRRRDLQLSARLDGCPTSSGLCLLVVVLMVLMNLRGVKESVLSLLPIFIAFIMMHVWLVGYATAQPRAGVAVDRRPRRARGPRQLASIGMLALAVIFFRAY